MSKETFDFVGSKLKQRCCNPCSDMQRSVFAIVAIALRKRSKQQEVLKS